MAEALDKLRSQILRDAELKGSDMVKEATAEANKIVAEAENRAKTEAEQIILRAKTDAEAIKRRVISAEQQKARWTILEEKNRLVNDVIEEASNEVRKYVTSKDYTRVLSKLIAEALESIKTEKYVVKLSESDRKRVDTGQVETQLEKVLGRKARIQWSDEPYKCSGGVFVSDEDGKIRFDNTFEARSQRLERDLLHKVSKTLFGE